MGYDYMFDIKKMNEDRGTLSNAATGSEESKRAIHGDLLELCIHLPAQLDWDEATIDTFIQLMLDWNNSLIQWTNGNKKWRVNIEQPFEYVFNILFHKQSSATNEQKANFLLRAGKQLLSISELHHESIYYLAYARSFSATEAAAKADALFHLEKYMQIFPASHRYFMTTLSKEPSAAGFSHLFSLLNQLLFIGDELLQSGEFSFLKTRLKQSQEFNALFPQELEDNKQDAANYVIDFFSFYENDVIHSYLNKWKERLQCLGTYDIYYDPNDNYFSLISRSLILALRQNVTKQSYTSELLENNKSIRGRKEQQAQPEPTYQPIIHPVSLPIPDQPDNILSWHAGCATNMQQIFKLCAEEVRSFIGSSPCGFAVLASGSFGFGHVHTNSDLDVVGLIISGNQYRGSAYWQEWLQALKYVLLQFNGRWKSKGYDTKKHVLTKEVIGLHFDPGNLEKLCETEPLFIQQPEPLSNHCLPDPEALIDNASLEVSAERREKLELLEGYRYQLRHSQLLYMSGPDGKTLWEMYQKRTLDYLQIIEKKQLVFDMQLQITKSFLNVKDVRACNDRESSPDEIQTSLKNRYLKPLQHYITLLRVLYNGLIDKTQSSKDTPILSPHISVILEKLKIHYPSKDWIIRLQSAWKTLLYQRAYLLQHHSDKEYFKAQRDEIITTVLKPLESYLYTHKFTFATVNTFSMTPHLLTPESLMRSWQESWLKINIEIAKNNNNSLYGLVFLRTGLIFIQIYTQLKKTLQKFEGDAFSHMYLKFMQWLEEDVTPEHLQQRLPFIMYFCQVLLDGLKQSVEHEQWEFDLAANYYQQLGTKLQQAKQKVEAFSDITGQLLVLQAPLALHRYYYRQLPEERRAECLAEVQRRYTNNMPDEIVIPEHLCNAPLSDGTRSSHRPVKISWLNQIRADYLNVEQEIQQNPAQLSVAIGSIELEGMKYWLKNSVIQHLINQGWLLPSGAFVKKQDHPVAKRDTQSNHLVIPYPTAENPVFYFKVSPEYPLLELWHNDWQCRLGSVSPRGVDLWLWSCGKYQYAVQVSQAVPGLTLHEWFKQNPEQEPLFAEKAFSETIILSAILRHDDGKPANIIIADNANQQSKLLSIDSDRYLVPSFDEKQELQVKDIAFCFKAMEGPLNEEVREEFLSLHVTEVLKSSINELIKWGDKAGQLFGPLVVTFYQENRSEHDRSQLLPLLPPGIMRYLLEQLQRLQDLFLKQERVTLWDILAQVDHRLANHYQQAHHNKQCSSPMQRFDFVAEHAYRRQPKNLLLPWFGQKAVAVKEGYSTPLNYKTFTRDLWLRTVTSGILPATWEADKKQLNEEILQLQISKEQLDGAKNQLLEGELQRFKQLHPHAQELLLFDLDWSKPNFLSLKNNQLYKWQRAIIDYLKEKSRGSPCYQSLSFQHCQALTDADISELIYNNRSRLINLQLVNCPAIGNGFANAWQAYAPRLKRVLLKQLPGIIYLGYLPGVIVGKMQLSAGDLDSLTIVDCARLQQIHIKAPPLRKLDIHQCPSLKVVRTESTQLEHCHLQVDGFPISERAYICSNALHLKAFHGVVNHYIDMLIQSCPALLILNWDNISKQRIKILQDMFSKKLSNYSVLDLPMREKIVRHIEQWLSNSVRNKTALDTLLLGLKDIDPYVRSRAALALGEFAHVNGSVISSLEFATKDHDFTVTLAANIALGRLGHKSPSVIRMLIFRMEESRMALTEAAIQSFAQVGGGLSPDQHEQAITCLLRFINDEDVSIRHAAVETLGQLGDSSEPIISHLIRLMKDDSPMIQQAAIKALAQLGKANKLVIRHLLLAMKDNNLFIHEEIVTALGQVDQADENIIHTLLFAATHGHLPVRQAASISLIKLGQTGELAVNALLLALKSNQALPSQLRAAETLLNASGKTSEVFINYLILALKYREWHVRYEAVQVLGRLSKASQPVINALLLALEDDEALVCITAVESLRQLGYTSGSAVNTLLRKMKDMPKATIQILGKLCSASKPAVDALLATAKGNNADTRLAAIEALGQSGETSEPVINGLLLATKHKDATVCAAAIKALSQLGQAGKRVIETLLSPIKHNDLSVRVAAINALGQLNQASEVVINSLILALKDSSHEVQRAAVKALGQLGKGRQSVIDALNLAIRSGDEHVRLNAIRALDKLGQINEELIYSFFLGEGQRHRLSSSIIVATLGELNSHESVIKALLRARKQGDPVQRDTVYSTLNRIAKISDTFINTSFSVSVATKDDLIYIRHETLTGLKNLHETFFSELLYQLGQLLDESYMSKNSDNNAKQLVDLSLPANNSSTSVLILHQHYRSTASHLIPPSDDEQTSLSLWIKKVGNPY